MPGSRACNNAWTARTASNSAVPGVALVGVGTVKSTVKPSAKMSREPPMDGAYSTFGERDSRSSASSGFGHFPNGLTLNDGYPGKNRAAMSALPPLGGRSEQGARFPPSTMIKSGRKKLKVLLEARGIERLTPSLQS